MLEGEEDQRDRVLEGEEDQRARVLEGDTAEREVGQRGRSNAYQPPEGYSRISGI